MLISHIIGGLGNQMFQYALGRSLALAVGAELRLDIADFANYSLHQGFELSRVFNAHIQIASEQDIQMLLGWRGTSLFRKVLRRRNLSILRSERFVVEPEFAYWPGINEVGTNGYLVGYWQSEKYFSMIEDVIREEFTFKEEMNAVNAELANRIDASNAVSLHVRRGDYAYDPKANSVHGLCELSYYSRAVSHMATHLDSPVFFVFSDDVSWVKENLEVDFPCVYIEHNKGTSSYNDMRLMSLCRHHIIANSSFSWWGAWLNPDPEKIVIAPRQWFCNGFDDGNLVPSRWIRL